MVRSSSFLPEHSQGKGSDLTELCSGKAFGNPHWHSEDEVICLDQGFSRYSVVVLLGF